MKMDTHLMDIRFYDYVARKRLIATRWIIHSVWTVDYAAEARGNAFSARQSAVRNWFLVLQPENNILLMLRLIFITRLIRV